MANGAANLSLKLLRPGGSLVGALENAATGIAGDILWKITGKPDVLLGIIPIYTAQRYEVARSHDRMKYRAVAGQFFAHQRGGTVGFKCVLYLVGPQALDYLSFIQMLHIYGQAGNETIDYSKLSSTTTNAANYVTSKLTGKKEGDAWQGRETHWTFPIITREEIMHDMYIETVVYERDVQFGDAIKLTVMCRQYHRPPDLESITILGDGPVSEVIINKKNQLNQVASMKSSKEIKVGYKAPKAGLINGLAVVELFAHRYYINNLADPMSELEKMRSIAGRLDGSVYDINGKLDTKKVISNLRDSFQDLSSNFKDRKSSYLTAIDEGKANRELKGREFVDANGTGKSIHLVEPKSAVLIDTITATPGTYLKNFNVSGIEYYMTIKRLENGTLDVSDILVKEPNALRYYPSPNKNISSNCYIASPSEKFYIIIKKNLYTIPSEGLPSSSITEYKIYRYNGDVNSGKAI